MNPLQAFGLDLSQCLAGLGEFESLLEREALTEEKDILPFFKTRPHLSAYLASVYVPNIIKVDRIKHEFDLAGDFHADLVVGDSERRVYCFVEFEDGRADSIFVQRGRQRKEWSPRFEHGFSQVVDWFWRINDLRNTAAFRDVFGDSPQITGMLVIGRSAALSVEEERRLRWRQERVLVDSQKAICVTFDRLAADMREHIRLSLRVSASEIEDW